MEPEPGDVRLGLSLADVEAYRAFWAAQDTGSGVLAASNAVALFDTSGLPRADLGDFLGAAGMRRGSPKTLPRRFWHSFGALLGVWDRFWLDFDCPGGLPGSAFSACSGWLILAANDSPND